MGTKSLFACLMVGLTICGCGAPEQGEEGFFSNEEGLIAMGPHCVTQSLAVKKNHPIPENVGPAKLDCFDTFAEAIAFATAGRVQLPPEAGPEDLEPHLQYIDDGSGSGGGGSGGGGSGGGGGGGGGTTYVIGIEYEHSNFNGSSYTIQSSSTCSGMDHYLYEMPSGWNDRISSAKAYSGCNNSFHYEHSYLGGANINCGTGCSYIGDAMNDRTSSIKWTQ